MKENIFNHNTIENEFYNFKNHNNNKNHINKNDINKSNKNNRYNKETWLIKWFLLAFAIIGITTINKINTAAAVDTTQPTISLSQSTKELTNSNVKVSIAVSDTSGISIVKWAYGSHSTSYFTNYGYTIALNSSNKATRYIKKNGIYTFYAKDKAGNTKIKRLTITNIDNTVPTVDIKKSTTAQTNKSVKLTLAIQDVGQGIARVKYLNGYKDIADFNDAGTEINFTQTNLIEDTYNNNQYTYSASQYVVSNRTITFLIEDNAGNLTINRSKITNIDKVAPTVTYSLNTSAPTNDPVTIRINSGDVGFGVKNAVYLTGSKTLGDFVQNDSVKTISLNSYDNGNITTSKNGSFTVLVTDVVGNKTLKVIKVTNIDTTLPKVKLTYSVMNQTATIDFTASDSGSGVKKVTYVKGKVTNITDSKWTTYGKDITSSSVFKVKSSGNYSVLVEDKAGNKAIGVIYVELEFKAVWISYLEFLSYANTGATKDAFKAKINTMFDKVVDMNMNAVVVQVRPFGDAMYDSAYFPWSKYISGKQGVNPGFDPLEYMVTAAHARGLEIHAWLNPYRVTTASTDYTKLSADNPARKWHEDDITTNDRNVLSYGGSLYYNPASSEVQKLIVNGIKEIVTNYDVDGIHFDDYFYPSLGTGYATKFDYKEYNTYVATCQDTGKTPLTIANWRRNNVNTLVKNAYSSIKKIDSTVQFGISPGGFYNTLLADSAYYTDIKKWLSSDGYIDYICPQLYWTFSHKDLPYAETLDKWLSFRTSSTVKVYVGIATYKAGSNLESQWLNDDDILKKQVEYGRNTGKVDGFIFFRYDFFNNKTTQPAVDRLLDIL